MTELKPHRSVVETEVGLIDQAPWNPQAQTPEEFNRLCENIREAGQLQIVVLSQKSDGRFTCISGWHTTMACKAVGYETVLSQQIPPNEWDEDYQTLQTIRMNVIRGKLDAVKFTQIWGRLTRKYDSSVLGDLMGFSDKKAMEKLIVDVKKQLPPELRQRLASSKKEIKTTDDLSRVLHDIMQTYGNDLRYGFLVFAWQGQRHHYVAMGPELRAKVEFLEELARAEGHPLTEVISERLVVRLPQPSVSSVPAGNGDLHPVEEPAEAATSVDGSTCDQSGLTA